MKFVFYTLIFLFSMQLFSQTKLKIVKNSVGSKVVFDKEFTLLLISHSNCGHCLIALGDLQSIENVKIVVINYGSDTERLKLEQQYSTYVFLDGEKILELDKPKFFPNVLLYENNDLIWKKKGWFRKNLEKISSKTSTIRSSD